MIKFFRKIRQKLLQEGKTSQYLKYAVGEIFLVVIGILIALSINNWNDARKQRILEKEFIEGVKNDLKQDKAYIQEIIEMAEKKATVYAIIEANLFEIYESDRATLDSLLKIYFNGHRTFYPVFGTFQSALSGNELSKFRDKKFTSSVTKLYQSTYARMLDNGKGADERWIFMVKKYLGFRRTQHLGDMTSEELTEFLNVSKFHMIGLNYYVNILKTTLVDIEEILIN
jgi:hypothetical protein